MTVELNTRGASILTALKAVDGIGSGLDADLLRGNEPTAFATAEQGMTADAALPRAGGNLTGNVTADELITVDGRDLSVDGAKLDTIDEGANVTDTASVTAAGALMDSEVMNLAAVKAFDPTDYATAAQGSKADTAVQPGEDAADLGSGAAPDGFVLTADGAGGAAWEAGGAGSSAASDLTWSGGTQSEVADGASAVAFDFDTDAAYSTSGAKLASWKNNGTEKAYIDKDGYIYGDGRLYPDKDSIQYIGADTSRLWINANGAVHSFGNFYSGGAMNFLATEISFPYGNNATIKVNDRSHDLAVGSLTIRGPNAFASATTNIDGGNLSLTGGAGASASAGDAHGGNVTISGGTGYGTGHDGYIIMSNLPASDPAVAGALWSDAGTLKISAG